MKELENENQVFDYEVIVPTSPENRYQCSCPPAFEVNALKAINNDSERRLGRSLKVLRILAWVPFYISAGAILIGHYEVGILAFVVAVVAAFGEWVTLK